MYGGAQRSHRAAAEEVAQLLPTATAATFLTGFAARRPPSSRISSVTVTSLRILISALLPRAPGP